MHENAIDYIEGLISQDRKQQINLHNKNCMFFQF